MPKPRSARLETPTARLKLPIRKRPYPGPTLARGIHLYYRRNRSAGAWVVKASAGGRYWTKRLGDADDFEAADGRAVLSYYQAQEGAKRLARGNDDDPASRPMTVADALARYERD